MPAYRTTLTIIAAGLMSAGPACAESTQPVSGSMHGTIGESAGRITVEESAAPAPALRHSIRLTATRFASAPVPAFDRSTEEALATPNKPEVALLEAPEALPPAPAIASLPLPEPVTFELAEIADKASLVEVVTAAQSVVPAAEGFAGAEGKAPQGIAEVSSRIVDLVRGGVLAPDVAAEVLVKLNDPAPSSAILPVAASSVEHAMVKAAYIPAQDAQASGAPVEAQPDVLAQSAPAAVSIQAAVERVEPQGAVKPLDITDIKLATADPASLSALLGSAAVIPAPATPLAWTLAREDRTVRTALERWARQVEWQVAWEFPTDFQIEFNADFDGDFIEAVAKVVDGLSVPERPVRAEFYKGNRVLRILSGRQ